MKFERSVAGLSIYSIGLGPGANRRMQRANERWNEGYPGRPRSFADACLATAVFEREQSDTGGWRRTVAHFGQRVHNVR